MIIGIDLGTTNSAVSCFRDGAAVLIPNSLGDVLTPSAVSITDSGELLVGLPARERQSTHPQRTATAFKRYMGTTRKFTLGGRVFSPEDLSALVLANLKADAEAWTGQKVDAAVVTVPAYFNDQQRKATRRAGELAGLTVERLLNEPTAAALAFGLLERGDHEPFLVFDLGGGTFDVSIVEVFENVIEVRASAGDNQLGGEDFNDLLIALAQSATGIGANKHPPQNAAHLNEVLRAAAERARRRLSDSDATTIDFVWDGREHHVPLTTEQFEAAAEHLVQRLREPVLRSLRDSGIRIESLSDIVLVGGATRMPIIHRVVTRMFGRFPDRKLHPDHAVALGAGVQAGLRARNVALDEVRLTDVCPFTLGIETARSGPNGIVEHGVFSPIIERNTVLPASRVSTYHTLADNQKLIALPIYQGEARLVAHNILIDRIEVPVPARKAGEVHIEVRFSYDTSGLLEVDISVPVSGLRKQWVISEGSGSTDDVQMRRAKLAALKIHPRDADANVATLARAERCFENFIGERRDYIGQMIGEFRTILERQEPGAITQARTRLEAALDELEGERFL